MIDKDYSFDIDKNNFTSDKISDDLKALIGESLVEDLGNSKVKITTVQSPFILADNCFDLRECNNMLEEFGVKRVETVQFTGGSFYIIFEKLSDDSDSYIIHGNDEEGFNIFNLL